MPHLLRDAADLETLSESPLERDGESPLCLPVQTALNGICPYFTMFPLSFPLSVLRSNSTAGEMVLDPFCGRGTTNFAARLLGMKTVGIDANPVATAIACAKMVTPPPKDIMRALRDVLDEVPEPSDIPADEFWGLAFESSVLHTVSRLREGLIRECGDPARQALRGILMGALHGPRTKREPSYFSNQCTRTFAPKPSYATRFWRERDLLPPKVDVARVVQIRAERYYATRLPTVGGAIIHGDSRSEQTFKQTPLAHGADWIITSPPYYGMTTYTADQWLRGWFVGGIPAVDYSRAGQLSHGSPDAYVADLSEVWQNVKGVASPTATLVVRFGAIGSRRAGSTELVSESLRISGWRINRVQPAGNASSGRRQVSYYGRAGGTAREEIDIWATLDAA